VHYYKRNIGDYAKKAGRLSMLQHGSYTLLIDACYDREQFPTRDEAIEWTWASSAAEIEAVDFVLRKFFVLEDGVYVQKRIAEEIAEYRAKSSENKRIAIERETKRKEKGTVRAQGVNEAPPNQEPVTSNQEPRTKVETARGSRLPDDFEPDFQFAVDAGIQNTLEEAAKFRDYWRSMPGQKGVKLDWPATWRNWCRNAKPAARASPASFKSTDDAIARKRWEEMTGRTHPDSMEKPMTVHGGMVFDVTAKPLEITQ